MVLFHLTAAVTAVSRHLAVFSVGFSMDNPGEMGRGMRQKARSRSTSVESDGSGAGEVEGGAHL